MVPRGLMAHPLSLSATGIPMHPTLSAIYRPSRLTRLWAQGQGVGVEGWVGGGDFSGKGHSSVLARCPVSHGPRPEGRRVNGKVLLLGAVAKSSPQREVELRRTWWKGPALPPALQVLGPGGGPVPLEKAGN